MKLRSYFFLWLILYLCILCTACSSKSPTKSQIKNDMEIFVNDNSIIYDLYEQNTPGVTAYVEKHNVEIDSISIDKSKTGDDKYEGWIIVKSSDPDIEVTSHLKVDYQKYDRNKWELESCEEYRDREIKFVGDFPIEAVENMFYDNMSIDSVEVLNYQKGSTAELLVSGTNSMGYYLCCRDSRPQTLYEGSHAGDVDFEVVLDFHYNPEIGTWVGDGLRKSRALTYADADILEFALDQTFRAETQFRSTSMAKLPLRNYYYRLLDDEEMADCDLVNMLIDNIHDEDSLEDTANFFNRSEYYAESSEIDIGIGFGNYLYDLWPALTYIIITETIPDDVKGNWEIDATVTYQLAAGVGLREELKKYANEIRFHIIYPYEANTNKAYVTAQDMTNDLNGTNIIAKTYNAEEIMYGGRKLRIENIEYPYYGWGEWNTYTHSIDIEYDSINW